jgi:quinol monooxygenase YgiN
MTVEYIRYSLQQSQCADFEAAYRVAQESLRASPHCLGFELSRCHEEPTRYILRIQWDSAEGHMQGFRRSPQFPPFLKAIGPFVPQIEEMRHYDVTDVHWAR